MCGPAQVVDGPGVLISDGVTVGSIVEVDGGEGGVLEDSQQLDSHPHHHHHHHHQPMEVDTLTDHDQVIGECCVVLCGVVWCVVLCGVWCCVVCVLCGVVWCVVLCGVLLCVVLCGVWCVVVCGIVWCVVLCGVWCCMVCGVCCCVWCCMVCGVLWCFLFLFLFYAIGELAKGIKKKKYKIMI